MSKAISSGDGCAIHPTCLDCPLPNCQYDNQGMLRPGQANYNLRHSKILELYREGKSPKVIAGDMGLTHRTVRRHIQTTRD